MTLAADLPAHPRLLLSGEEVADLKHRMTEPQWATQWKNFFADVDALLKKPIELPPRGGNWSHNFVCPIHGTHLTRGKQIGPWQWEYICPVGNHVLKGDPKNATIDFDGNAIADFHMDYADEIQKMGLAYQLTGDKKYADRARDILLAYADKYLTYPRHDNEGKPVTKNGGNGGGGGGGRIASQPLTEATWVINAVQGMDMIWDRLSPDDRTTIETKMLRPALEETIINQSKEQVIHNIQCRRNSAEGLIGFMLGDQELIHDAIDGKSGFRAQVEHGVRADGAWEEGSWGYHFFTIEGLIPLAEAARNCGVDLYGPQLKKMFDAPLAFATPGLTLPAFNDSGEVKLDTSADRYELAYARYQDPKYIPLIKVGQRKGRSAMLFGVDELPSAAELPATGASHNSTASGFAVLQKGENDLATWACMKYGPHGGAHGHFDKLNVVLWTHGEFLGIDSGTRPYGSPLHKEWDKTTLAHNTLTVDENSQAESTGKNLAFGNDGGVDYVMSDAGPIYKDVDFVRTTALLSGNVIVFVDQVSGKSSHTYDIAWHQRGKWGKIPQGEKWSPPKVPGYEHFIDTSSFDSDKAVDLPLVESDKWNSRVVLAGDEKTQIITGTGIGANTADQVPMVVFRRKDSATTFVWGVSIDGSPLTLDQQADKDATKASVNVSAGDKTWHLQVDRQAATVRVR